MGRVDTDFRTVRRKESRGTRKGPASPASVKAVLCYVLEQDSEAKVS